MNHQNHKPITFLLADDHSLIRQGILFILEEIASDFNVHQASTLQQITETVKNHPIDIAVIDVCFPDGNFLPVLPEVKKIRPDIKILIYTGTDEHRQSLKFINAGADGFLSKMSEEEEVKEAVLKMITCGEYISQDTQRLLMNSLRHPDLIDPLLCLTEREKEIAEMYASGYGNLEIANLLDVKQNTVSTMKKRIFDKLKIDNLVELIEMVRHH
ncbi:MULTISPECIES: response regulator [Chryseobacterium]|uniref:DNA-binding NarL/FixJ family response regulator n=1 Tax=Chryseobacterium camelliae TaxID=1265445 RepID=A0ABU0TJR3_9FLAO|nr:MULTISPECIES: response regulator transcription factor [Chryseobacterium]MDT3408852.1 DNA-binding NarL/FixJ family response regulator [Pseudacidovorax intermedius]MDQ1097290.1 DNA-binding NarL/FixJ family response regulator [Chryseobacterium camelliae]MDQ1101223.1 DNA-binding NarL/FixJ family response regulator [Chryseobacterium sp. SORGH_AS_1048]MDR6084669.1 DNA-binding NarL/FixJ family response regulator [Chryseobacterium sp. SORGH_AS_0909]MDR6132941.1 DNA-binding NarL/FixJ family response